MGEALFHTDITTFRSSAHRLQSPLPPLNKTKWRQGRACQWFKYSSEYPVAQPQLVGISCYNSTLSPSDTICSIDPQLLHPLSLFRVTKVIRGSTQNSFLPVPILSGKGLFKTTIPLLLKVSYHFLP